MKKKTIRLTAVSLVLATIMLTLCGCSGSSVAGTWYYGNYPEDDPIILTKDGTFSWDGYGGNYTVDNGKVILTASFLSEVFEVSKVDGNTVLVTDKGHYYFNSKSAAEKYYQKEANKIIKDFEASKNHIGTFAFSLGGTAWADYDTGVRLTIKADGTYSFTAPNNEWQEGTWSLSYRSKLSLNKVYIDFHKTSGSGNKWSVYLSDVSGNTDDNRRLYTVYGGGVSTWEKK